MERPAGGGSAPSPWTPSRLFIGTATRSCATPPLPQHRTRRQQKAPSKHTSAARRRRPSPYFVCHPISTLTRLLPIMLHICDHYHYAPLLPLPLHSLRPPLPGYYRSCCTRATTTTRRSQSLLVPAPTASTTPPPPPPPPPPPLTLRH